MQWGLFHTLEQPKGGLVLLIHILIALFLLILLVRIATLPLKLGLRLLLNTLAGYLCLFALNWLGLLWGLALSINLVTALIVGVFGLPGLAALLLIRFLCLL